MCGFGVARAPGTTPTIGGVPRSRILPGPPGNHAATRSPDFSVKTPSMMQAENPREPGGERALI
jgi:hypothetical protein